MVLIQSLCLFLSLIWGTAWAQKSNELDLQKAMKNKLECERLSDLGLVKSSEPQNIICQIDSMIYASEVVYSPKDKPVRMGNFNLLHPGTDKTLFKDVGLVAELIDNEFDVMAAVELVDVVATPKANNLLLLPLIGTSLKSLTELREEISRGRLEIQKLSIPTEPYRPTAEEVDLKKQMVLKNNRLSQLLKTIALEKDDLKEVAEVIAYNSLPGRTVLGFELGKKRRLKRLQDALGLEADLKEEIAELEKEQTQINNQMASLQDRIEKLPRQGGISDGSLAVISSLSEKLGDLEEQVKNLNQSLKQTTRYYRIPGYLKILEELRKLDSSWSLIVSSHGDAAVESNAQELSGFYYRASRIQLDRNEHCSEKFQKDSSGCYPEFGEMTQVFSRRPFLASFKAGKSKFSMLAAHVVFESSEEPETQKNILQAAFGVTTLKELPTGINKQNYARFAETFVTLKLIEKLRAQGLEHIVYAGDFNIEAQNPFWKYIFEKVPGSVVLVEDKTSLSENRFVKSKESFGLSSNYDHFIMSAKDNESCSNAGSINFVHNIYSEKISNKYLIRVEGNSGPYQQGAGTEELIEKRNEIIKEMLEGYNFDIVAGKIVRDGKMIEEDLKNFNERVFNSQLNDETFYKLFVQVMSDHLPIKIECEF